MELAVQAMRKVLNGRDALLTYNDQTAREPKRE